jgi:hypothetical protein
VIWVLGGLAYIVMSFVVGGFISVRARYWKYADDADRGFSAIFGGLLWPLVLVWRVIAHYPITLGEWIGNQSIEREKRQLEAKKVRIATMEKLRVEAEKAEAELDAELSKEHEYSLDANIGRKAV